MFVALFVGGKRDGDLQIFEKEMKTGIPLDNGDETFYRLLPVTEHDAFYINGAMTDREAFRKLAYAYSDMQRRRKAR